ncbi:RimJ/RimL family protein N-acetyltransferase [Evansella vedderi]|uniref:RimJ/RimL family protein N-acetyltransferase n=1 Tax=Evansella vedderi TaxID=38282 RepID=A0ABT9ZZ97_9BACI|nr:GNAT family N-acetyltransferase [Evansella vedderi]MDQ0256562.1 RimJ/RimL family protein N-acetyltransferase [Evansella vedderi]
MKKWIQGVDKLGIINPIQFKTKSNDTFVIRTANSSDGYGMHQLTKEVLEEEKGLIMTLRDFNMTIEDQMRKNDMYLNHPQTLALLAEHNRTLIGILTLEPEYLIKTMHRGNLGIVIKKEYRSLGIGKKLMTTALSWAKKNRTYEKIELEVLESNKNAIALYEKLGFIKEGNFVNAVKHNEQKYEDLIRMGFHLFQ